MHFELDLAIAYACTLGLFCWLASWFVPLLLGALVRAAASLVRSLSTRGPGGGGGNEHATSKPLHGDWWGPSHHAR